MARIYTIVVCALVVFMLFSATEGTDFDGDSSLALGTCASPMEILECNALLWQNITGADSVSGVMACNNQISGPGGWYTYTTGSGGNSVLEAATCFPETGFATVISVYTGTCGAAPASLTCVASSSSGCGQGQGALVSWNASPHTQYIILVTGQGSLGNGAFQLTIRPGAFPSSPYNLLASNIGPDTVIIEWENPLSATVDEAMTYIITYSCSGDGCSTNASTVIVPGYGFGTYDNPEYDVMNLIPNTPYTFTITASNSMGMSSSSQQLNVTTGTVGPTQACSNALAMTLGTWYVGTAQGTQLSTPACGENLTGRPTAWFSVVGTGEVMNVTSCLQSSLMLELAVFTGTCETSNFQCIAFTFDNSTGPGDDCGVTSFMSTLNTFYYIAAVAYNYDFGSFQLSANSGATTFGGTCDTAGHLLNFPTFTFDAFPPAVAEPPYYLPQSCDPQPALPVGAQYVWYQAYLPPANGPVTISLCSAGTSVAAQVNVYSGVCTDVTCPGGVVSSPCGQGLYGNILSIDQPQGDYWVVVSTNVSFSGSSAEFYGLALDGPVPPAPTGLYLQGFPNSVGQNYVALQWTPGVGAPPDTSYTITCDQDASIYSFMSNTDAWTITELSPWSTYTFNVQASNLAIYNPGVASFTVTTLPAYAGPVTNLVGSAVDNAVAVEWQAPSFTGGPQASTLVYTVCYEINADPLWNDITCVPSVGSVQADGVSFEYTVEGLAPLTPYAVTVYANNTAGMGAGATFLFETASPFTTGTTTGRSNGHSPDHARTIVLVIIGLVALVAFVGGLYLYRRSRQRGQFAPLTGSMNADPPMVGTKRRNYGGA